MIYCFEKKGVLRNVEDGSSVIESINRERYEDLKKNGSIAEGMLPKLHNCFEALQNGVSRVIIGSPELLKDPELIHTTLTL